MSGLEPLVLLGAGGAASSVGAATIAGSAGSAGIGSLIMGAQAAGTALTALGSIASGRAAAAQGRAGQQAAEFEAKQLDIKSKEEKAAGQQEMLQYRRQKNLALSRLQTVGAGSGFSATDPTSLALADEITKYGTFQEQLALFGGTARERDLQLAASGRRFEGASALALGKAKRNASYLNAAGTIIGGVSSMADKYAKRRSPSTVGRYG